MGLNISPGPSGVISTLFMTQQGPLDNIGLPNLTKTGTVTGTAGFGSSLFLQRITIPSPMSLTEIDCAMRIAFNASSDGAGTMSRSLAIYSFGNSSSLATVCSASGTSSWNSGTVTAGASTSLTQFQDGWALGGAGLAPLPIIQPFTFAATQITGGEYVVAQLFDFAQVSSTWSVSLFGPLGKATNSLSSWIGAAASGITGTAAGSGVTGVSSYASNFLALSTAGSLSSFLFQGTASTAASSQTLSVSTLNVTLTNSNKSCSFQLGGVQSNSNIVSSIGVTAGSILTGLTAGSMMTNSQAITLAATSLPSIRFIGTGSGSSGASGQFIAGTMSTGAIPVSIALSSTAVSYTAANYRQPWFALVGS